MTETEQMLAQVYVHCPICYAMIHETNKARHWYWHKVAISEMAHGMWIVAVEKQMEAQGVTWPGDLKEDEHEPAQP